ncbi:hypothetical protein GCM10027299_10300 [Larkinella ripae]
MGGNDPYLNSLWSRILRNFVSRPNNYLKKKSIAYNYHIKDQLKDQPEKVEIVISHLPFK